MRASGPLILRIFIKNDQAADAANLADTVRDRAAELGLADVSLKEEPEGPVVEIAGDEEALRRFWAHASDLGSLGLIVLQAA